MSKKGTKRYLVPPSLVGVVGAKAGGVPKPPASSPSQQGRATSTVTAKAGDGTIRTAVVAKAKGPKLNPTASAADFNMDGKITPADTRIARELTKIEAANVKTTDAKAVVASGMADIAAFNAQAAIWTAQGTKSNPDIVQPGDTSGGTYQSPSEEVDPYTGEKTNKVLPVAALAMPVAVVVVAFIALFGRKRAASRGGES